MKPDVRSKLRSLNGDLEKLRSRNPDSRKFDDWRKDVEKKLEEGFGKSSDELQRFRRIKFFDFSRRGRDKDAPLGESERREYLAGLEEARRLMRHVT